MSNGRLVDYRTERTKMNIVVDDPEDSIMTATIPDFVTNISPKPSKGKEKDEGAPSKVVTVLYKWNTQLKCASLGREDSQVKA